jgi:hypothetical protein
MPVDSQRRSTRTALSTASTSALSLGRGTKGVVYFIALTTIAGVAHRSPGVGQPGIGQSRDRTVQGSDSPSIGQPMDRAVQKSDSPGSGEAQGQTVIFSASAVDVITRSASLGRSLSVVPNVGMSDLSVGSQLL